MSELAFLKEYGEDLINAGYRIVPIPQGAKLPVEPEWQKTPCSKAVLREWLNPKRLHPTTERPTRYHREGVGIGILTEETPAVDIDITDKTIALKLEKFVCDLVGYGPVRIGLPPKRLILFRCDEPFRKLTSAEFLHPKDGSRQAVEILGKGQQFVAFAIHPKTEKPYEWVFGDSPLVTPAEDLPVITVEQARQIIEEAERLMAEAGWELKSRRRENELTTLGKIDHDNPFAADKHKVTISDRELHQKLLMIPNDGVDYETWISIGMALYHQYDGSDEGLELWQQWSEQSNKHDTDYTTKKWESLDIDGKGREPLTARYILKLAQEQADLIATEVYAEVIKDMKNAASLPELKETFERIKRTAFDVFQRAYLVGLAQKCFKKVTDNTLSAGDAKKWLRYENPEAAEMPNWLKGWVYIEHDETFYSVRKKQHLSTTAFNAVHSRFLLTRQDVLEGRSMPEQVPSQVALNLYQIEIARNRMFMPGQPELFWVNGVQYVNSYSDQNVPAISDDLSAQDRRNMKRVMHHFSHLFTNDADRRVFIDWMAYIVQTGQRVKFAVLLQGVQEDGKSFFGLLMAAMLGMDNVRFPQAQALQEHYTPWAEGAQVCFFEEIKLQGHNRYDVLNRVKPFITNVTASIRRMNTDIYDVVNTVNYILSTNYKDALPIGDDESRYLILFSRFQTREQLLEFRKENPDYYDNLYAALAESPGALRKMFMEWELSPDFNPNKRAPDSAGRREMIAMNVSDESEAFEEVLAESGREDISKTLLNATDLADLMSEKGCAMPYGRAANQFLLSKGFTRLGKVRLKGAEGRSVSFWSQTPEKFTLGGVLNTAAIHEFLENAL